MKVNFKYLFTVFFIGLTIVNFITLDKNPLQPWDEGIYAVRVQYLLDSGNWIDQTEGSIGGLYSSSHPPLYIWLTAVSTKVFGLNEFGLRFWSLLFGLGSVLLMFFMNKNKEIGFYASIILGTIPFFLAYCKLGQLDVIYTFFIVLAMFGWLKYENSQKRFYLILIGIAFGMAMMSKIIVGFFIPLSIGFHLMILLVTKQKKLSMALREMSIILGIGLVISLPWLTYMFVKYRIDFLNNFLIYHVISRLFEGVEHNTEKLGPVFFVNQLLVMLSFFVWIFIWNIKNVYNKHKNEFWALIGFAIVPFVIFTVSTTKLRTYAIPILPPLSLLAAYAVFEIKQFKKINLFFAGGVLLLFSWAIFQNFRDDIQSFNLTKIDLVILISIIICSILMHILSIKPKFFIPLLVVLAVVKVIIDKPIVIHQHKLESISDYYYENQFDKLFYIDTKRTVDDPLITYYFKGMDINNDPKFEMIRPEQNDGIELNQKNRNSLIIINTYHKNDFYRKYVDEEASNADLIFEDDLYNVYEW